MSRYDDLNSVSLDCYARDFDPVDVNKADPDYLSMKVPKKAFSVLDSSSRSIQGSVVDTDWIESYIAKRVAERTPPQPASATEPACTYPPLVCTCPSFLPHRRQPSPICTCPPRSMMAGPQLVPGTWIPVQMQRSQQQQEQQQEQPALEADEASDNKTETEEKEETGGPSGAIGAILSASIVATVILGIFVWHHRRKQRRAEAARSIRREPDRYSSYSTRERSRSRY